MHDKINKACAKYLIDTILPTLDCHRSFLSYNGFSVSKDKDSEIIYVVISYSYQTSYHMAYGSKKIPILDIIPLTLTI